eukprot:TRINITY_DN276_c0_g2_i6.p2 TRINITY_DN276_c0_g2~~TRINITY_DN276_c0_g2_i6.p2  ORF type:complete len:816 (+),score=194.97 TRINITY_DN276_c0_g2_i6:533-2980(+)
MLTCRKRPSRLNKIKVNLRFLVFRDMLLFGVPVRSSINFCPLLLSQGPMCAHAASCMRPFFFLLSSFFFLLSSFFFLLSSSPLSLRLSLSPTLLTSFFIFCIKGTFPMKAIFVLLASLSLFIACGMGKKVHVVYMNHLDVGFNGKDKIGFTYNVVNLYFDKYFPLAVKVSEDIRKLPGNERFVYTTHSWLVSLYLHCPPNGIFHCPTQEQRESFIQTVQKGDIVWHAFPFNGEAELIDSELFKSALGISKSLSDELNVTASKTMSQRDVPGLSRSVIPLLRENGVTAISIGVNTASAPPAVARAFVWKDPLSGTDIIGTLHPGGYGGIKKSDCIEIEGMNDILCTAFRGDNAGPPDVEEVLGDIALLEAEFLGSEIQGSTFDAFMEKLQIVRDKLPHFSEEIGDTWIYGCASDPVKLMATRALNRASTACIAQSQCSLNDVAFSNFTRFLLKNMEHTWGVDVKTILGDWINWTNVEFERARSSLDNYKHMEEAWNDQRSYTDFAINALYDDAKYSSFADALKAEYKSMLFPEMPSISEFQAVNISDTVRVGDFEIRFDKDTGAICHLQNVHSQISWASESNLIGKFMYQSLNETDYDDLFASYSYVHQEWVHMDFGKPNVESASPLRKWWWPKDVRVFRRSMEQIDTVAVRLSMPDECVEEYGCPEFAWIFYQAASGSKDISTDVYMQNKTPTRLPESVWFQVSPKVDDPSRWTMDKMGEMVSPTDVMVNGSRHLHGVWSGIHYEDSLWIETLDAALVSPGAPQALPGDNRIPDLSDGWAFNLFNNLWGTNYIMWYPWLSEENLLRYRFILHLNA